MSKSKSKLETYLLIGIAAFGLIGLAVLQFARRNAEAGDKNLVQVENRAEQPQTPEATVQKIPGYLLRISEHPEQGKPFKFSMAKHSQGPVYELLFDDGTRKSFNPAGELIHTFNRPGRVMVTLYARYEGEEVMLDTMYRRVANKPQKSALSDIFDD